LDDLETEGFRLRHPKGQIMAWLQEIGLLAVIPVDHAQKAPSSRTRFYSFDIAKSPSQHATPLELLQACCSGAASRSHWGPFRQPAESG
jgi:hypothetical protein